LDVRYPSAASLSFTVLSAAAAVAAGRRGGGAAAAHLDIDRGM